MTNEICAALLMKGCHTRSCSVNVNSIPRELLPQLERELWNRAMSEISEVERDALIQRVQHLSDDRLREIDEWTFMTRLYHYLILMRIERLVEFAHYGNNLNTLKTLMKAHGIDGSAKTFWSSFQTLREGYLLSLGRDAPTPEAVSYFRAVYAHVQRHPTAGPLDLRPFTDLIEVLLGVDARNRAADAAVRARVSPLDNHIWGGMTVHSIQSGYYGLFHLLTLLDLQPGQTLVDVGSGYGRVGHTLGMIWDRVNFVGYEIAPERVHAARANAERLGLGERVRYIEQDLQSPNLHLAPADVYFLFDPTTEAARLRVIEDLREKWFRGLRFRVVVISGWSNEILEDFARVPWLQEQATTLIHQYQAFIYETK
jgi:hypothetical protein